MLLLLALTSSSGVPPPTIVLALTDDLGWNYPSYHGTPSDAITPTLDSLALTQSVRLESFYVYKYCSPTRSSFLTGRYPYHLRATRCNLIPASIPEGLDLSYELLPKTLAKAGYESHHVGKWHMGFHTVDYTPVGRGFNTSWGFLEGGEDHFTSLSGAGHVPCDAGKPKNFKYADLWAQSSPGMKQRLPDAAGVPGKPLRGRTGNTSLPSGKPGLDSTYTAMMFTQRVVEIVKEHGAQLRGENAASTAPLFIYWALHNTHAPIEAPQRFIDMYAKRPWFAADQKRATFAAMMSVVDEAVLNVTTALKEEQMWTNTVFVWTTDNGSPINGGGSNHPLRGGKGHNWEGGIHVPSFVAGGLIPTSQRGSVRNGLVHIADLYATFAGLAGLAAIAPASGPAPSDSIDMWEYISKSGVTPPRMEIIHDHHMFSDASASCGDGCTCAGQSPFTMPGYAALGALRVGDLKLIVGVEKAAGWFGVFSPNTTNPNYCGKADPDHTCIACDKRPCLFNITNDPGEHMDLADDPSRAADIARLMKRFKQVEALHHPEVVAPNQTKSDWCSMVKNFDGFVGTPWWTMLGA